MESRLNLKVELEGVEEAIREVEKLNKIIKESQVLLAQREQQTGITTIEMKKEIRKTVVMLCKHVQESSEKDSAIILAIAELGKQY